MVYVYLKGDEFHPRLDIKSKAIMRGKTTLSAEIKRIGRDRQRAHDLDAKYSEKRLNEVYKDEE